VRDQRPSWSRGRGRGLGALAQRLPQPERLQWCAQRESQGGLPMGERRARACRLSATFWNAGESALQCPHLQDRTDYAACSLRTSLLTAHSGRSAVHPGALPASGTQRGAHQGA